MILKKGRYRYNGFYENWKSVKLGNFVDVNPKSFLPRKFKYVDLESVVGTKLISFREEIRESAPSRAQRVAQKGDVFFQTVRPYQKNNYLFDLNEDNYVFSTGYAQLRPKVDSAFLLARLQEEGFVNKVIERCTGTSYPAINSKDLSRISITIPEHFEEQSAIGTLFRTLDDLLASYKDNLTNYQSLKATMLSKMFPKAGQTVPEIRLDGFEGEWELIKLGEVCDLITKGTTAKSQSEQGKVNFIKVENLKDNEIYSVVKISEEEHLGSLKRSILFEGDILFSIAGTLGRTAIVRNNVLPANTNQALAIIRGYKLDAYFLLVVLSGEVVKDYIRKNPTVGAQPNLSLEQVSSLKIQAPSIEEQRAIGLYFSNLDNLINSYQEKISQLETLKKKLLQDMFI